MAEDDGIYGFCDKISGAGFIGACDGIEIFQAGDHNDRRAISVWQAAKPTARFEPVHHGHHHIHQDNIRPCLFVRRQGLRTIFRLIHKKTALLERLPGQYSQDRIIIDEQGTQRHRLFWSVAHVHVFT